MIIVIVYFIMSKNNLNRRTNVRATNVFVIDENDVMRSLLLHFYTTINNRFNE